MRYFLCYIYLLMLISYYELKLFLPLGVVWGAEVDGTPVEAAAGVVGRPVVAAAEVVGFPKNKLY